MPQKTRKWSQDEIQGWSVADVKMWLRSVKLEDCIDHFTSNSINGVRLLQLTSEDIGMMPGYQNNEKKKKQLKKAIGTLPGNSMSKKAEKKTKMKKQKGGSKSSHGGGGGGRGELPPIPPPPSGPSSIPPLPNQRPPPIPGAHPMMEEDTYEDPAQNFGMPPEVPPPMIPGMHSGMESGLGYDPETGIMDDIYDAVDEMELGMGGGGGVPPPQAHGNGYPPPRPPMGAPPIPGGPPPLPAGAPPPVGYPPGSGYDDDDQEIYEEGAASDEEGMDPDDSFESSGGEQSEEYESPFEDDEKVLKAKYDQGLQQDLRDRGKSDANIRAVMGKFYAHEIFKDHTTGILSTSAGASVVSPPPPPGPPDQDPEEMSDGPDEIYDTVPEDLKNEMAGDEEEGIFEDIYDIPPDELEAVKEQVGAPWKPPAKPPAAPPPADPDEPEDVYDIPSEAVEQAAAGGMGKPPAPPPATPPPIDEDIYDMGDDEEEEEPTPPPAAPVPFQPARPPKSSPFNDRRGPPFSTFQPPHLAKPPIGGGPKAPAAPPPDSPPAVLVESLPPRPPKPAAEKPPPPPPVDDLDPPPSAAPPPPPTTFTRPMIRPPISSGPPPPRPPTNTKDKFGGHMTREDNLPPRPSQGSKFTPNRTEPAIPTPPRPPPELKPPPDKKEEMTLEEKLSKFQRNKAPAVVPPPPSLGPKPPGSPKPPGPPKPPGSPKPPAAGSGFNKSPSPAPAGPRDSPSSSLFGANFPKLKPVEKKQEPKKPSASPQLERKFAKPSEMKKTPFGSNMSNGPTGVKAERPPPAPPIPDSKPSLYENKGHGDSKGSRPPPAPKKPKISNLMKQFEKGPSQDTLHSESPSPQHNVVSPVHKSSLGPPKRVDPDTSPMSGRRFHKKESLGDLRKKFEDSSAGSDRSMSPPSKESSRGTSPDGGRPFLPPKPGGGSSSNAPTPPWLKNRSNEEKAPPPPPPPSSNSPNLRPPFGRAPSPKHTVAAAEPSPGSGRPLPPRKKEPPKPIGQQPGYKTSPSPGRRFPPPAAAAPPEPPSPPPPPPPASAAAESEKIKEDTSEAKQQNFVYKPYRASVKKRPPSPKPPTPEIEEELSPEPPPVQRPPHLPPLQRPPIAPDSSAPPLPSRPPPSQPPVPSMGDMGRPPDLPSRPPPQHKPPFSPPEPDMPSLPPRPTKQAPPGPPPEALPPLPSRPWHNQAPPIPPVSEEPPPPSRPPKSFAPSGSPSGQSWYHYSLDRKQAESKLKRYTKDGTFIVRDSTKIKGEYSLSLWFGGGVRHLRIRLRGDKKFVLGEEKSDELAFVTVMDLVAHHKQQPLHLKSGGETVLKYECPS